MKAVLILFIGIILGGCSGESVRRSDSALSLEQTGKKIDFPLPPSAHDLYFLLFAGGLQDLESYLRFDVAPQDLDATVESLISDNNKKFTRSLPYPKSAIPTAKLALPRKEFLPMPWWNPGSVTKGYFRGETESYSLQILVDVEHSRIYLYQND